MLFSKYIEIIFIISILIFINAPSLSAQEANTTKVQTTQSTEIPKSDEDEESYYDIDDGYYNEDEDLDEEDEKIVKPTEHEHEHAHEHTHEHVHEHNHGHTHEHSSNDVSGGQALFGRGAHQDHDHDDCDYFHKAWREPGTTDIMKKYSIIIFSLFGIIAIYRIISTKMKNSKN